MVSVTELYNMALNAISARNTVSLPSEQTVEAETCSRWYEPVRDQVFASARWPEATKFDYLALVNEKDDDTWVNDEAKPGFQFAYAYPTDALLPQYLTDYGRFSLGTIGTSRVLMTNTSSAILAYTYRSTNPAMWSSQLYMAIAYGLAANICMPLTGKASRAQMLVEKANDLIIAARETAANLDNEVFESIPDWIAARGYSGYTTPGQRYFYPYGSLLAVSA